MIVLPLFVGASSLRNEEDFQNAYTCCQGQQYCPDAYLSLNGSMAIEQRITL